MLPRNLWTGVCLIAFGGPVLAPFVVNHSPSSDAVELRIESLTGQSLLVRVTSTPPGLWPDSTGATEAKEQVVLRTPALVNVADSVLLLRVSVVGAGAVRIQFGYGVSSEEQRVAPRGRDITLSRGVDGHFRPVWKVHPLIP